jgi:nucleoside phosphorylase
MKTLLIYALNPEAGIIKQYFPEASIKFTQPGMELLTSNKNFDLLRTGIGLERAEAAVNTIPTPNEYDRVIQFGVSGSLDDGLKVRSLIRANRFTTSKGDPIELEPTVQSQIHTGTFHSAIDVVADEASRIEAASQGAMAVDMESYAIAKFCKQFELPLLALRIISDRAGSSTPEEFRKNFKIASQELQRYLIDHVLNLP